MFFKTHYYWIIIKYYKIILFVTIDVRDPNWNIEDCQADIIFEKDLYHIPMVDPTAYIIRGILLFTS